MTPPEALAAALADRYRLERPLGAGGMATVYLATDLRHGRQVAIKVLKPELAAVLGAERFVREIRTIAALQHPHILGLIDSGEVDGTAYYVMPFVEGESLRDRLSREKQLPVADAVGIATEVALALDYAHRHGVIHRDIKPENILLHDGAALVADFGIALAVSTAGGSTRMTETGMSLGTPHYMSPEQAMGERDISFHSDLYALGCVLYEMLVGEPPFTGPTAQAIVARVVTEQPRSIIAQRRSVPPFVEAAVNRAVEKLPADRFPSAAAFASALREVRSETLPIATAPARRTGWRAPLVAAATLLMTAVAAWGWYRPEPQPEPRRFRLQFSPGQFPMGLMQLSPSGEVLVYAGPPIPGRHQRLYAKHLNKLDPDEVPGIEPYGAFGVSPNGQFIVYTAGPGEVGPLKRMPLAGGMPITLADSALGFGAAWLRDGNIAFLRRTSEGYSLWRVPAAGGKPVKLWAPDSTGALVLPVQGPDGQVLVTRHSIGNQPALWTVNVETGVAKMLIDQALLSYWAASGHIVYGTADGTIYSIAYDARRRTTVGDAIQVLHDVEVWYGIVPLFALAESGALVGIVGPARNGTLQHAILVDRDGRTSPFDSTWSFNPFAASANVGWSLAPDGTHLAIGISDGSRSSIFIKQMGDVAPSRLTFDGSDDARPRWTPDSKAVTFISSRNGKYEIFQANANGIGGERVIASAQEPLLEAQYSSDMQWLVLRLGNGTTHSRDIHVMRVGVDTLPRPLIASPDYDESALALSPDGKWIAFQSEETGSAEVFIRPFPDAAAGKWQVSRGGGYSPLWNPKGGELFFIQNREMMSVTVGTGEVPEPTTPRRLFTLSPEMYAGVQETYTPHTISPDGNRFVMLRRVPVTDTARSVVVLEQFLGQ